jgi:DNA-binding IclR family transcriptional regulator
MDFFVREKKPLSVRDIVEEFSWPRSSAFNIISTMVEHGYLYQPVPRGGYYPTSKWTDLARDLFDSQPLPESVHDLLIDLMKQTGETIILSGPEGTSAVFLDVVESPDYIRYTANIGQRLPIHVTAAGRAILAQYPPEERALILKRINYRRYEKATFMTAESVEEAIREGSKKGWHINLASYAYGVAGVAVPFPFRNHRNAIVLGAPVSRVEHRISKLGKLLRESIDQFLKRNT